MPAKKEKKKNPNISLKVVFVDRCMYKEYLFEDIRWLRESAVTCLVVSLIPVSENTSGIKLVVEL